MYEQIAEPIIIISFLLKQDKVRKSLHELQPSAMDKETLVGADRMIKSTQQAKEAKSKK